MKDKTRILKGGLNRMVYVIILICYLLSATVAYLTIKKDWQNKGWQFESHLLIFVLIPFFNLGATYAAMRSIKKFNNGV